MNAFDKFVMLAELENSNCILNHGPGTNSKDYPAINYINLPIGYKTNENKEIETDKFVIPICQECIDGLQNDEWVLFYCLECNESQWINKRFSKLQYKNKIIWLKGCPKCTKEFGGIYFNDKI